MRNRRTNKRLLTVLFSLTALVVALIKAITKEIVVAKTIKETFTQ